VALVSAPIVSRDKRISKQCEAERITAHEYPPTVWAVGEVVQETVHISTAQLQPGSYAVWMEMCARVTQMHAAVEAGHERLLHDAGVDAEPIPELEFDQTLRWKSCAVEMAHVVERGLVEIRRWRGAGGWCELPIPDCRHCAFSTCSAYQISANTEQKWSLH